MWTSHFCQHRLANYRPVKINTRSLVCGGGRALVIIIPFLVRNVAISLVSDEVCRCAFQKSTNTHWDAWRWQSKATCSGVSGWRRVLYNQQELRVTCVRLLPGQGDLHPAASGGPCLTPSPPLSSSGKRPSGSNYALGLAAPGWE